MPRFSFHRQAILALAVPGLFTAAATEIMAGKMPAQTVAASPQTDPPPPPVPDPTLSTPDPPGAPMYRRPFGTMEERPVPVKQYPGDAGTGAPRSPATTTPTPLSPAPLTPAQQTPPNLNQAPMLNPYAEVPTTDRFGIAPPPGTLGHTYSRRTRLVSEKKHPRVGVVEVRLSENYDVSAIGLKSKWTGSVWELESDPLLPGIPHIYEVTAEWGPEGAKRKEIRTVRLIMGRVVDLDF